MDQRSSGILLHIISLSSRYGIGDLGPGAYQFVDFLNEAGQRYWQILPINPTDSINGHSPYSCLSAFAGNPLLISPDGLLKDGWIEKKHLKACPAFNAHSIEYNQVIVFKEKLFNEAWHRFKKTNQCREDFNLFCIKEQAWLDDYSFFTVLKSQYQGQTWNEWPAPFCYRQQKALSNFQKKFADEINKIKFIQYLFFKQWDELKCYCREKNIHLIGDIPIYVNHDSADVWTSPLNFKLNKEGAAKFVSGVPPDYFSKTGQRWGNPVFDWNYLKKTKYAWWVKRLEHNLKFFDILRMDHFRGFVGFWQIPAHEKIAVFGKWMKAPGKHFFGFITNQFKGLPIIVEDLGHMTPDVIALVKSFKFPGMRVLLFGLNGDLNKNHHFFKNYIKNCVAYTGTHDNNTIQGWLRHEATLQEKENIFKLLKGKAMFPEIHWALVGELMKSEANTAILSMPDLLGLGQDARMNTPSTIIKNWQWRMGPKAANQALAVKLLNLTKATKRHAK